MKSRECLKLLREYASELGVAVRVVKRLPFGQPGNVQACWLHPLKTVFVKRTVIQRKPRYAVFALAHELGHAEITGSSKDARDVTRIFNAIRFIGDPVPAVIGDEILRMETEATDRGLRILAELGIELDDRKVHEWRRSNECHYEE